MSVPPGAVAAATITTAPLTRAHSPSPSPDAPPSTRASSTSDDQHLDKRQKRSHAPQRPRATLPYGTGLHLAPMVRIGTLPVRLAALDYGASLVWGPEIVDKAIIGATRSVDPRTGVVSFVKNNRSVFECHPLERPRLIFQLGSADPDLAVQALRVIEQDVAGVGLNCGCPKAFSLQGGMGAALLKDPERLCSILEALVGATDLPIDAKIRLLPLPDPPQPSLPSSSSTSATDPSPVPDPAPSAESSEPTIPLVKRILATGIANLTVHCRTQTMRSSQPALLQRMAPLVRLAADAGVPIVCNGDGDGWANFEATCRESGGVGAVMLARAAEANPSCFRQEGGWEDPETAVIPKLLRIALATGNNYANTKYILNALNLHHSPTPPSRERNRTLKQAMNQARSYEDMCAAFGIGPDEVEEWRTAGTEGLEGLVPDWVERRRAILRAEEEAEAGPSGEQAASAGAPIEPVEELARIPVGATAAA